MSQTTQTKPAVNTEREELLKLANSLVEAHNAKPTIKDKLKSRKFWIAAAGCITGICGMIGFNQNTTAVVVFIVLEIVSVLAYSFSESSVDTARAKQFLGSIATLIEMIEGTIDAEDYVEENYGIDVHSDAGDLDKSEE